MPLSELCGVLGEVLVDALRFALAQHPDGELSAAGVERLLNGELAGVEWLAGLAARLRDEHGGAVPSTGFYTAEQRRFYKRLLETVRAAAEAYEAKSFSLPRVAPILSGLVAEAREFGAEEDHWVGVPDRHSERRTSLALGLTAARILGDDLGAPAAGLRLPPGGRSGRRGHGRPLGGDPRLGGVRLAGRRPRGPGVPPARGCSRGPCMTDRFIVIADPPTPNGDLHVGHLSGPYFGADALTRFLRLQGKQVVLLSNFDSRQPYVATAARRLGRSAEEVAVHFTAAIARTLDADAIEPDLIGHPDRHQRGLVDRFFQDLHARGKLLVKDEEMPYCSSCERFLFEAYLEGTCPHCGAPTSGQRLRAVLPAEPPQGDGLAGLPPLRPSGGGAAELSGPVPPVEPVSGGAAGSPPPGRGRRMGAGSTSCSRP